MEYKFSYNSENEMNEIIERETCNGLYVLEINHYLKDKHIIFTDEKQEIIPTWEQEMENKISILEQENKELKTKVDLVNTTHSDLIFDIDFRVMDLEDAIGANPVGIKLFNLKNMEGEVMNSTFVMLLDKVEGGRYENREEIESMADRYLARNRITVDEYDMLMKALDKKEAEKNPTTPEQLPAR